MRAQPERLNWFVQRIGKIIYRNDDGCDCDLCKHTLEHGIFIHDLHQAQYCYDIECDFNAEGTSLRYFDTPEEVKEWLEKQKAPES